MTLLDRLFHRAPAPERLFDMALTMRASDTDLIAAPLLECVVTEGELTRLGAAWREALAGGNETAAATFWATVNGQTIYHGVILTNITSITGTLIPTVGAA